MGGLDIVNLYKWRYFIIHFELVFGAHLGQGIVISCAKCRRLEKNWNFIPTDPRINRKKLVSLGRVLEIYSKRNTNNKMGYIMVVYRLVLRARWGNILGTTATGYPPKVSPNECGWWPALTRNVLIHPRYRRYWDIGSPPMNEKHQKWPWMEGVDHNLRGRHLVPKHGNHG